MIRFDERGAMTARDTIERLKDGSLKTITCVSGETVRIDADDWTWARLHDWHYSPKGAYRDDTPNGKRVLLRTEIMNCPEDGEVVVLDKDKDNCSKSNLQLRGSDTMCQTSVSPAASKELQQVQMIETLNRVRGMLMRLSALTDIETRTVIAKTLAELAPIEEAITAKNVVGRDSTNL